VGASLATAVVVGDLLAEKGAILDAAGLVRPEAPEALVHDLGVLAVEIGMHLDVTGAHIHLGTVLVDAVVVGLFPVVGATLSVGWCTVVRGGEAGKAQLEAFLALLVPLQVPDDVVLLAQDLALAGLLVAMEVLPQVLLPAQAVLALQVGGHFPQVLQYLLVLEQSIQAAGRREAHQALALLTRRRRQQGYCLGRLEGCVGGQITVDGCDESVR